MQESRALFHAVGWRGGYASCTFHRREGERNVSAVDTVRAMLSPSEVVRLGRSGAVTEEPRSGQRGEGSRARYRSLEFLSPTSRCRLAASFRRLLSIIYTPSLHSANIMLACSALQPQASTTIMTMNYKMSSLNPCQQHPSAHP